MEKGMGCAIPTVTELFMMHAPAEPQPWFEPVMEKERPKCLMHDPEWHDAHRKQRYVQWPAAWAFEVMKTRSVK